MDASKATMNSLETSFFETLQAATIEKSEILKTKNKKKNKNKSFNIEKRRIINKNSKTKKKRKQK